jgi:hypothetical protein
VVPVEIQREITAILGSDITEDEARRRYPSMIKWFNEHVDLADLIRQSGVTLRPLSPDSDVLVGHCPSCGRESLMV